jgi:hypothetical protein
MGALAAAAAAMATNGSNYRSPSTADDVELVVTPLIAVDPSGKERDADCPEMQLRSTSMCRAAAPRASRHTADPRIPFERLATTTSSSRRQFIMCAPPARMHACPNPAAPLLTAAPLAIPAAGAAEAGAGAATALEGGTAAAAAARPAAAGLHTAAAATDCPARGSYAVC